MRRKKTSLYVSPAREALLATVLLCGTALAGIGPAQAQGLLQGIGEMTYFGGMSLDGGTIVGSTAIEGDRRAAAAVRGPDGYTVWPLIPAAGESNATAVSADGQFIVGYYRHSSGYMRAFRWVSGEGATSIGVLHPHNSAARSFAHGVSDDGTRVVGYSAITGIQRAFAWIENSTHGVIDNEQMHQLTALSGGYGQTVANAISGDGRYAAGYSDSDAPRVAVRWDLSNLATGGEDTVLSLGGLSSEYLWSEANAISGNGQAITGTSRDADGRNRAFLWQEGATHGGADNPEMRDLGTLGGDQSWGAGISRDGKWVVGHSDFEGRQEHEPEQAFRWSEETGMESIVDWLERNGVSAGDLLLIEAKFISDDGSLVGGHAYSDGQAQAYIARVDDEHGGGLMDVDDYRGTLSANAAAASTGEFLTWLALNGAHHRPLLAQPELEGDACAWATGDLAHHNAAATTLGLAEVGACLDIAGGVRMGAGVGASHSWQDLVHGGHARLAGHYLMGEIGWQPEGAPLVFSLTGMAGRWDVEVKRGYTNGAAIDHSLGETDLTGGVLRGRVDWLDAAVFGNTAINPFAAISVGRTHLDGYTETGGAFPARFDDQTNTMREIRLGVTAVTAFSEQVTLSTTLEAVHRGGDNPGAQGQVDGLFGFDLGGGGLNDTWVRAGAEIDYRLADSALISASFNAATAGRDATFSGSLGLRGQF